MIRARQEANLAPDQLTDRLGAADAFINKIENGKRSVGFFEFDTIMKAMGDDPFKLARETWDGDARSSDKKYRGHRVHINSA